MNQHRWILLALWFAACITAMHCLRFESGIYAISDVAVGVGIALILALGKSNKSNPS